MSALLAWLDLAMLYPVNIVTYGIDYGLWQASIYMSGHSRLFEGLDVGGRIELEVM